jgi:hypothetical protein
LHGHPQTTNSTNDLTVLKRLKLRIIWLSKKQFGHKYSTYDDFIHQYSRL